MLAIGCARITSALPVARVVHNIRLVNNHRADVLDNVIAGLALDALIVTLDGAGLASTRVGNGNVALVQDGRVRSARATVEGMSIQVKRNLLGRIDGDVFRGVVQQLNGLAVLSRVDGSLQTRVRLRADLRHAGNNAVRAIAVVDRSTTFRTQVGGDGRRERTAGNSDGLSGVVESRLLLRRVLQLIPTVIDDEPAPKSFL